MLPPTLNQMPSLPRALVMYSHYLMGNAIKSELVCQGVEVTLSRIEPSTEINHVDEYHYIIVVVSGQEGFFEAKDLINSLFTRLNSKTKLSVVIGVAQLGINRDNQIFSTNLQEFDFAGIKKTLEAMNPQGDINAVKTQIVWVEDLVDFSPTDGFLNPLQAMLCDVGLGQINLIGSLKWVYYPLSSTQAAELIVRELFVLRQKLQFMGVRGKLETSLIKLVHEVKHLLLEKGVVDPKLVSLFSDFHSDHEIRQLVYSNPAKTIDLKEILKKVGSQSTYVNRIQVPQVKELPINLDITRLPSAHYTPTALPTPQPHPVIGEYTQKKIITKPKQVISAKPIPASIKRNSPKSRHVRKPSLLIGFGIFLLTGGLLTWIALPFMQYASIANALTKPTKDVSKQLALLTNLTRAQERMTVYFSLASQITPTTLDGQLFALNEGLKQSTNTLVFQTHLASLNQKLSELLSKNLNLTDGDVYQSGIAVAQLAQTSYQDLTTLELSRKQAQAPAFLTQELEFGESKLKSLKTALKKLQLGLESLPYLLPANQSTNVLVLLQNSHELRATGGFIESVGLLRFNSGKLLSSEFTSSYELDELLKGRVEPPEDLRRFLGENQWYGRDANWDPDFTNVAKNAAWFYEKQTNNKVDVVVAVTTPVIGALLEEINGVTLGDGTVLDENNLSNWLTESQKKLSGAQTTQPLLSPIVELILKKIQTTEQVDLSRIASALGSSLENSQLLIAGFKPEINSSLTTLGWTGSVLSPVCPAVLSQAQCVVDTLYVNESNVGVNSANAQVSRAQTHTISFQADRIIHTHQINYTHTGQNDAWPGGVYQNYLRYYLPQNARLIKASQDGVVMSDANIVQTQAQNKNLIGFLVRIQPASSSQVVIEYDEINPLASQKALTYAFLLQKQPGIVQAPLSLTLDYPEGYSLKRVSHPYALSDNHLLVNDSMTKHFFLAVELTP